MRSPARTRPRRGRRVRRARLGRAHLVLLRELAPDLGFALAGLIHVNHGLRGAESDADEAFCRALADRLDAADRRRPRRRRARARERAPVDRSRGARRALRVLRAGGRATSARRVVATGHTARRPGRDRAAAAAARRRHAAASRHPRAARASTSGRCSTCRRADLRRYLARARRAVPRGRLERRSPRSRATASGTICFPSSKTSRPAASARWRRARRAGGRRRGVSGSGRQSKAARSLVLSDGAGVQLKVEATGRPAACPGPAGRPPSRSKRPRRA